MLIIQWNIQKPVNKQGSAALAGALGCMLNCKQFVCTDGDSLALEVNATILLWNLLLFLLTQPHCQPLSVCRNAVMLLKTDSKIHSFLHRCMRDCTQGTIFVLALALLGHTWQQRVVGRVCHLSLHFSLYLRAKWAYCNPSWPERKLNPNAVSLSGFSLQHFLL